MEGLAVVSFWHSCAWVRLRDALLVVQTALPLAMTKLSKGVEASTSELRVPANGNVRREAR